MTDTASGENLDGEILQEESQFIKINKKNVIIGISVIVLLIIILGLIYVLIFALSGPSCGFATSPPDETIHKLGHSSDNQALVDVSAFLQYPEGDIQFKNDTDKDRKNMLLKFRSFKFEKLDEVKMKQQLRLTSDCADVSMNIEKNDGGFQVRWIGVTLKVANYGAYSCKISTVNPYIVQESGFHYLQYNRFYPCYNSVTGKDGKTATRIIVYLAFNKLEFEIYGEPKKTARDEFSTPAKT